MSFHFVCRKCSAELTVKPIDFGGAPDDIESAMDLLHGQGWIEDPQAAWSYLCETCRLEENIEPKEEI